MERTIEIPSLIDVSLETSEKLHRCQYLAFELMSLLYSLRLLSRDEYCDEVLLDIWIRESEQHLDNVNALIDRIQHGLIEKLNAKSN